MSALEAARLGDQIGHTHALLGFIAGVVAGVLLGAFLCTGVGAVIAAVGFAALLGNSGMRLGATYPTSPKGPIKQGSSNTLLGRERRRAARAGLDWVKCDDHDRKTIAQGSATVLVNNKMFARKSEKVVCSATIREGCQTVRVGGPTATVPGLELDGEVPSLAIELLNKAAFVSIFLSGSFLAIGVGLLLYKYGGTVAGAVHEQVLSSGGSEREAIVADTVAMLALAHAASGISEVGGGEGTSDGGGGSESVSGNEAVSTEVSGISGEAAGSGNGATPADAATSGGGENGVVGADAAPRDAGPSGEEQRAPTDSDGATSADKSADTSEGASNDGEAAKDEGVLASDAKSDIGEGAGEGGDAPADPNGEEGIDNEDQSTTGDPGEGDVESKSPVDSTGEDGTPADEPGENNEDGSTTASTGETLHRPYIRNSVREAVEQQAPKTADGRFIDPNTGLPIDGTPDFGHKPGHEFWREKAKAESEGLTQKEFNDRMNDPDLYQLEDPSSNRSHKYEMD